MLFWTPLPFVRLLLPFLLGIIAEVYLDWEPPSLLLALLFLLSLCVVGSSALGYRYRWLFGGLTTILLFFLGLLMINVSVVKKELSEAERFFVVELIESPQEKANSWKVFARIVSEQEKVLLYFQKDGPPPAYGSQLILKSRLQPIESPKNPGEFHYQRFLSFRQIHYQSFIKKDHWRLVSEGGNSIKKKAIQYQKQLLKTLKEHDIVGEHYSVASALLLGFKGDLTQETSHAFSTAGAMHILAVSGLHVGIIYLLLHSLLLFMERNRWLKVLKAILLILLLWSYALLTGLSPSVMRAASMFSFVIVGKAINRQTNIYNTLAASAFFLLIFNPFLLFEVGFQLSYLAVLGIVFLQKELYLVLTFKHWLFDKMWAITCVSIAAQMATFPLGLLYFHQFPNYFLLSNLVVIPLATIIMQLGVALFIFQSVSFLAEPVAWLLKQALLVLLQFVQWLEALPHALSAGISISIAETYLLYAALLAFSIAFVLHRWRMLTVGLCCLLGLIAWDTYEDFEQEQQQELLVYRLKKHTAIAFIDGREAVVLMDPALLKDENKQRFHLMNHWWDKGLKQIDKRVLTDSVHNDFLFKEGGHIQFGEKRLLILDKEYEKQTSDFLIELDYLLISGSFKGKLAAVLQVYKPKKLLLDGSLNYYQNKKRKAECEALGLDYYEVAEGAWEKIIGP